MRDALKNVFGKELILDNGDCYLYTIQPYQMKNVLGTEVAVLDEYSFNRKNTSETFKLYRTKEGNWYNLDENKDTIQTRLFLEIKTAISVYEEQL
ncbi:MAG: hypothetical protein V9F02_04535 [Chitinophagaceae bacterium]|jgi:hypothetical protein